MKASRNFSKDDLKLAYDEFFEPLRGFLYYKSGDIDLSEDLVQEVFITLWNKRDDVRKETLKSFLYTIANNLLINHYKHKQVVMKHEQSEAGNKAYGESPQFKMEEKEFETLLNKTISDMPDGCREVFLMNRIDKLTYDEIAERLGLSVKAIEKRMSSALKIIREKIDRKI